MGLFRRKNKNTEAPEGYLEGLLQSEPAPDPRQQAESEALELCEQLMEQSRGVNESKKEYRAATKYLQDIQALEELPEYEYQAIQDAARSILALTQKQKEMGHRKQGVTDAQYAQMSHLADEMPDNILRLKSNENYQSMVKRDMANLEGEKIEWGYYLESVQREIKMLKVSLAAILLLLAVGVGVMVYLQYGMRMDMATWILAAALIAVLAGSVCMLRLQGSRMELSRSRVNINRAIALSNRLKTKYVHAANAVDFACERFHVNNSLELNYLWEQYMDAVKERKAFEKANEDLEFFNHRLMRLLKQYRLFDAEIWQNHVKALVDKNEMAEVKHALIVQRQTLRDQMERQVKEIQHLKQEILNLVEDKKEYHKEIMEVLRSVDKMCGE